MIRGVCRRELIKAGLAGAAAAAWPFRGRTEPQAAALTTTALDAGMAVIAGAGANVTVLGGPDGALLVDGGLAGRADDVLAAVAAVTGSRSIKVLFDTNWRPEHTGANERLHAAGATILAHENTKLWIGADFEVEWAHLEHAPRPAAALPDKTFYTGGGLEFAGRSIDYGYLPRASTDGDIYVLFPDADVLVVSDLLAVGSYPLVDYVTGGWIGGLEQATKKLLDLANDTTRVVPASGPVQRRKALEDQLALCTAVREAVRDAYRSGHSLEEFMAAKPTAAFDAERGDPTLFLRLVYKGAWGHVRELGGGII